MLKKISKDVAIENWSGVDCTKMAEKELVVSVILLCCLLVLQQTNVAFFLDGAFFLADILIPRA